MCSNTNKIVMFDNRNENHSYLSYKVIVIKNNDLHVIKIKKYR